MLRRVLAATDGSEHAARAEAFAARLAAPDHPLEIELLYVHPQLAPRTREPDPSSPWHLDPPRLPPAVVAQAQAVLHAAECRIRVASGAGDVRIWCRFLGSDDVAGWIVHEADRACADLIVLGGRDHRGLLPLLEGGGVCTVVLRRAHRPIVLVPGAAAALAGEVVLDSLGFGTWAPDSGGTAGISRGSPGPRPHGRE